MQARILAMASALAREISRLARIILVALLSIFAGCTISKKEAQLPPLIRAERRLARAEKSRSDPQQEAAEILSIARIAANEIPKPDGEINSDQERSIRTYNRAAEDLAGELPQLTRGRDSLESLTIQNSNTGEIYRVQMGPAKQGEYSPGYFQELLSAQTLRIRRGEQSVVRPGLGGTLVGVHRSVSPGSPPPRLQPSKGYRVPVTSIIEFGRLGDSGPVETRLRLRLINPLKQDTVEIGKKRFPLAANFSAPFLSYGRLNEIWLGFVNMIRGQNMRTTPGLLMFEPYDPNRIPVIFVHGLLSSTFVWRRTALALLQDPEIRQHYQFWAFSYSTGNPISFSALRLREDLAFAQERFGPKRGVVLIGHSMGGLLCRMQVTNSGRAIWNEVFGPQAPELYSRVPDDSRAKRALIFQANPAIKRVIFVATPHRGSSIASGGIGAIAIRLIRLPFEVLEEIPETIARTIRELGQDKRTIVPTSIQGLSPNSPLLHALNRLPIEAPHHSIIGDRGRGNTPNSSDGVVPYWSSHLDSAESERIVPSGHDAMVDPQAVEEIRRLLLENLRVHENR
jgi:pimeloyl-ACP methyl ester carboxylesterase